MNATLQSLRFVFVMMIFMSHFNYRDISCFDAGGDCGVAFFFLLSGFALSMGYGNKIDNGSFCFRRFIKRRLLKLYPLHLLCLALFLVLFRPELDYRLVLNTMLLQSWVPESSCYFSYNGVAWFLSCLLFFYLIFPLLYRWANRLTLCLMIVYCIAVYVIVPYSQINAILYVSPLVRLVDFFFGIMLYKFYAAHKCRTTPAWTELLLIVMLALSLASYPYADEKFRNAPLFWLVLIPFIYVFAFQQGPVSRCLKCQALQWLSSLSMPIFLLHPIVIRSLFHFFPAIPSLLMLLLCLAITIALSWLADRLFLRYIEQARNS